MTRPLHYDIDGTPIETMERWAMLFKDAEYKRVARDDVAAGVFVSTVWLGLDHGYGEGPPLIFETLVFGGTLDGRMPKGHVDMVAAAREAERGAQQP